MISTLENNQHFTNNENNITIKHNLSTEKWRTEFCRIGENWNNLCSMLQDTGRDCCASEHWLCCPTFIECKNVMIF